MRANSRSGRPRSRHFDRAFALLTVSLLAACSASSGTSDTTGTAGTAGTGAAGTASTAGTTGTGGTGGSSGLPVCAGGAPTFGVCFVSDADVLPLPLPGNDAAGTRTNGATAATIMDVGIGTAPAQCESARAFGARGPSDWWFQAKTADNHLWTIGVRGLASAPLVAKNDSVTLDLDWHGTQISSYGPPKGHLQLSNAAATPLLWAGAASGNVGTDGPGWLTFMPGAPICRTTDPCDAGGYDVVFTVNSSRATLPPSGSATTGGYFVANGALIKGAAPPQCYDSYGEAFDAAAVKVP